MNEINASDLLSQIRTLGRELQPTQTVAPPGANDFGDMLKSTLNAVNDTQQHASDLKIGFANGTTDKSLAEVMIASQKADLSFRAVTEVRNKLVSAYQDIMNMPV
ncbi:MAG: flagellar hook-basal body complex protein FliE [Gammaproteobacteria bacterium]|jgi:flagellar hook-basal body complex protein FliE|nr:flagellar hook-basal body complex protein FliE [Gammaproteobacteria bacterium]